jgi:acyl-CoA dehydrogenase
MLGSGLEAFERTLNYLKLRKQFGVLIGSFQALKHRAALMYCEIELTKSAVLEALTARDENRAEAAALASLAKAKACEMLELVSNEAVQLHGGIGMTDAEEIGFFLKRARVAQQLFGDASFHRDRYASLLGF